MEKSKNQLKREAKQEQRAFYRQRKHDQESSGVHVGQGGTFLLIHTDDPLNHGIWFLSEGDRDFLAAKSGDKRIINRYIRDLVKKSIARSQLGN